MRNVRRRQVDQKNKRSQLVFLTFGILLSIYFTVTLIIGDNGLMRYLELKSIKDRLFTENVAIEKQNDDIKSEIKIIENEPDMIEELAREYGLTREDELIFKFEEKE